MKGKLYSVRLTLTGSSLAVFRHCAQSFECRFWVDSVEQIIKNNFTKPASFF